MTLHTTSVRAVPLRRKRALAATFSVAILATACGSSADESESGDDAAVDDGELVIVGDAAAAEPVQVELDDPVEPVAAEPATSEPAVEASGDMTEEDQALAFAACMRDEGLDWPDPITGADGSIDITGGQIGPGASSPVDIGSEEFGDAVNVCGPLVEGASFLPGGGSIDAETQDQLLEFTQCLRAEGVEVDDPDFSVLETGRVGQLLGDFDPQDPANADAIEACQTLFAGGLGG